MLLSLSFHSFLA